MKFSNIVKNMKDGVDGDMHFNSSTNQMRTKANGDWIDVGQMHENNSREIEFYNYMKEKFGLTEEEFINILKKEHPESLI